MNNFIKSLLIAICVIGLALAVVVIGLNATGHSELLPPIFQDETGTVEPIDPTQNP